MSPAISGLRKRRVNTFVQIPSKTIRDKELSFRSRGLLGYLLDMPDGWDVKSEVLSREGKEGREAIRTALHELGSRGYYRLERRQLLNGTFAMGTAISEEVIDQWASDYAEYDGKAVPVVQQRDGSFRVKHKDGTLTDDGFDGAAVDGSPDGPDDDGPGGSTGDGFPGPGSPGAGEPDSGAPDAGGLGALGKTDTQTPEGNTSAELRSTPDAEALDLGSATTPAPAAEPVVLTEAEIQTGRDEAGNPLKGKRRDALAEKIAKAWWEWCTAEKHAHPASGWLACRAVIRTAVGAGVNPKDLRHALAKLTIEGHAVSGNTLQIALRDLKPGTGMRRGYDDVATWGDRTTDPAPQTPADLSAFGTLPPADQPGTGTHG